MKKPLKFQRSFFHIDPNAPRSSDRLLIRVLALILVPLLAIALIAMQVQNTLSVTISETTDALFDTYCARIDDTFNAFSQVCQMLQTCSEYTAAAALNKMSGSIPHANRYELNKLISKQYVTNSRELAIVFADSELVMSRSVGLTNTHAYYEVYLTGSGLSYNELAAEFRQSRPLSCFALRMNNQNAIAIVQALPIATSRMADAYVAVTIDQSSLNRIAQGNPYSGATLIYASDGRLLYCSDPALAAPALPDSIGENQTVKIDGKRYILLTHRSSSNTFVYASLVPVRKFNSAVTYARMLSIGLFGMLTIVAALLGVLVVRKTYRPMQQLLDHITRLPDSPARRSENEDEYEYISQVITTQSNRSREQNAQIARYRRIAQRALLQQCLMGAAPGGNFRTLFANVGLNTESGRFVVFLFRVTDFDLRQTADPYAGENGAADALFEQTLSVWQQAGGAMVLHISRGTYACVLDLFAQQNADDAQRRDLAIAAQRLLTGGGLYTAVGVSTVQTELDGLHSAYTQAALALDRCTLHGETCALYQAEREAVDFSLQQQLRVQQQLTDYVTQGAGDPRTLYDQIQRACCGESPTPFEAKHYFANMRSIYRAVAAQTCPNAELEYPGLFASFAEAHSLVEFRLLSVEVLELLRHSYETRGKGSEFAQSVAAYLTENFTDPDLGVNTAAAHFDLTPTYFSRLFRDGMQISIMDFITQLRISRAQELLTGTNRTIAAVAEASGFLSSNVFIKTFKRIAGVTPGQYRAAAQSAAAAVHAETPPAAPDYAFISHANESAAPPEPSAPGGAH